MANRLTPERRSSSEETTSSSLLGQRRYSRAYEQPIVQQSPSGGYAVIRTDDDTHSEAGSTTSERRKSRRRAGNVLNPEVTWMGTVLAEVGLGLLVSLAALVLVVGSFPLEFASRFFGFSLVFLALFATCCGLFVWWGSWAHTAVDLSVKKVLILYGVCSASDVISRVVVGFARFPLTEAIPAGASYYFLFSTNLLLQFALFAHQEGLNAMFSSETLFFVGLTVMLDMALQCIFGYVLPPFLLSQAVYVSCFLGTTLSLVGSRFPSISLSNIYRVLKRLNHPSVVRKLSRTSVVSTGSSQRLHRTSFSSLSSMTQFNQVCPVCPVWFQN